MRTEIQSMVETGLPNVPVVLFADGSSALIVGAEPRYNGEHRSDCRDSIRTRDAARRSGVVCLHCSLQDTSLLLLDDLEKSDFEIIRTHVETIPNTQRELAFDIHSTGWRAVITPKVPIIIGTMLPALIKSFLDRSKQDTAQYDWYAVVIIESKRANVERCGSSGSTYVRLYITLRMTGSFIRVGLLSSPRWNRVWD